MGSVEIVTPDKLRWSDLAGHMADDFLAAWTIGRDAHADLQIAMGPGWLRVILAPSGEIRSQFDAAGTPYT